MMTRYTRIAALVACSLFTLFGTVDRAQGATPLTTVRIASGLNDPVWAGSPACDEERIFIVEQRNARILILKNGALLATPFLDIKPKVLTSGSEQGLLGLAFHPDFDSNGYFYVDYTSITSGATVVERYQVSSGNPDVADASSGTVMLGPIPQPFANHNGGCIVFGPNDGYLYVGMGDGGGAGDPSCNAQNGGVLLGKILRIDVDNGGTAPPSNPFVGDPNVLDEIWAFGLRNPWRFSFDRLNGDLYIGDVGQNSREEVDWVPGTSTGGENYGWKVMEGTACFGTSGCTSPPPCGSPQFVAPVLDYTHALGCSVTGGHVYRGCAIPDLDGTYFYSDYCSATIWSFQISGGLVVNHQDRTNELDPPGATIDSVSSFGEDGCGEILICDHGGEVFKIVPAAPAPGADLGYGLAGGGGEVPLLSVCGLLDSGNSAKVNLSKAAPASATLLFASLGRVPISVLGGTLVPDISIPYLALPLVTGGDGRIELVAPGGAGVFNLYIQFLIADAGAPVGVAFSNAYALTFQP